MKKFAYFFIFPLLLLTIEGCSFIKNAQDKFHFTTDVDPVTGDKEIVWSTDTLYNVKKLPPQVKDLKLSWDVVPGAKHYGYAKIDSSLSLESLLRYSINAGKELLKNLKQKKVEHAN